MEHLYRFAAFVLALVLAFYGTQGLISLTNALNERVADQEGRTIGGEHPAMVGVWADERRVIPRSEAIELHIQNRFSSPAVISYSLLLTSETGEVIASQPDSPVVTLASGETTTHELTEPVYLDEGLYTYQITVAGSSDGEIGDSGVELNFAVLGDSFHILTNEEWFSFSLANSADSQ